MKLEHVDTLFSKEFKSLYLGINKEPRRVMSMIRHDGTRTSMSYARYLFSVKLGRKLLPQEHVDHIDNNKLNDIVDNLQLLTPAENNRKERLLKGITRSHTLITCPVCNKEVLKRTNQVKIKIKAGQKPCCSRKCGGIYSHRNK